jgi:hypothetical protein
MIVRRTLVQRIATTLGLALAGFTLGLFMAPAPALAKKKAHPFFFQPPSKGSSFGASWDSWASAKSTPGENSYSNELELSYSYSPDKRISFEASDTFSQSVQENGKSEADFEDLWLTSSLRIPLSDASAPFVFRTAASLLLPASHASQAAGMTHTASLLGEVSWRSGRWSIRQSNAGYVYFYDHEIRPGDTAAEEADDPNEDDGFFVNDTADDAEATEGESRTAYQTVHRLVVSHRFTRASTLVNTARFSHEWKESVEPSLNPEELSISSRFDYDWSDEFETYAGLKTMTDLAKTTSPPLFDGRSCTLQLGFKISL